MKRNESNIAQETVQPIFRTSPIREPINFNLFEINKQSSTYPFSNQYPILKTPIITRYSRKTETLSPFATEYLKALDRARTLEDQVRRLTRDIEARDAFIELLQGQLVDTEKRAETAETQARGYQTELLSAKQDIAKTEARAREQLEAERARRAQIEAELSNLRRMREQQRQPQTNTPHEYYAVLGLDPRTAFRGLQEEHIQRVIGSVYRVRSQFFHPDRQGNTGKFQELTKAYEALKDPKTRPPFAW